MALFGRPNIAKLRHKGDVKGLVKLLDHPDDATIRIDAAAALVGLGDSRGSDALVRWFELEHVGLAEHAVSALGSVGNEHAVGPLLRALEYSKPSARSGAIRVLRGFEDPRIAGALLICLAETLDASRISDWYSVRDEALKSFDEVRPVDELLTALSDPRENLRAAAAHVLGGLRPPEPRAVDPLIAAVEDKEPEVRESAARALGRLREPTAIDSLLRMLDGEESSYISQAAAEALAMIAEDFPDDPRMPGALVLALPTGGEKVATQLKNLDADALELVADLLGHEDPDVRVAAYKALWLRGVDRYGGPHYVDGIQCLGAERDPWPVGPVLLPRLQDADDAVRARATRALGVIQELDALQRTREDRSAAVRVAAVEALLDIGRLRLRHHDAPHFREVRTELEGMQEDGDQTVRAAVTSALRSLDEFEREYHERWDDYTG